MTKCSEGAAVYIFHKVLCISKYNSNNFYNVAKGSREGSGQRLDSDVGDWNGKKIIKLPEMVQLRWRFILLWTPGDNRYDHAIRLFVVHFTLCNNFYLCWEWYCKRWLCSLLELWCCCTVSVKKSDVKICPNENALTVRLLK